MKIISTTEVQKNIWTISREIENTNYTVINRGKPKMVILPYFEDNDDFIQDYLEEYEMSKNSAKLRKELQESLDSGLSDLII